MFEKTEGRAQNLAGKIQEAVGDVIGDRGTQFEGRARQVAGRMQESYGGALDQLRDVTASQPLAALAAVAAVSFVVGALWSRR